MNCAWDADRGLGVLIRGWRVVEVAGQLDCKCGLA
jgi:hypothetical protein